MKKVFTFLTSLLGTTSALTQRQESFLPPVHLAVSPRCGTLNGTVSDLNAGVNPANFKAIVSFGDSFTDGGIDNGTTLLPAVVIPPNPFAGWRSTNGPVWAEDVANATGADILSYAQWAACTDLALWPSNPRQVDFLGQMATFLGQNHQLDPDTTLYSMFFGINDWLASQIDGDHMQNASHVVLDQIEILSNPPTNGRSFLVLDVYGRGTHTASGEAWKQTIYDGLADFHLGPKQLNVAYVDFSTIWDAVFDEVMGYVPFGYVSSDACTSCSEDCNEYGWCHDPDHYFQWFGGHPSKETHRLMAEYVLEVFTQCRVH
ncbi:carbohydrate esterase family 16 protein [Hymenopellis radicata]|nr:carbohydrate esterase family 16 protein [Hymenopellis radicata]